MSMALPSASLTPPKRNSLTHIPGDEGWPIIGNTLQVLADPKGFIEARAKKYGPVYRPGGIGFENYPAPCSNALRSWT